MTKVKFSGYYDISTFTKGGKEIRKATYLPGGHEEAWEYSMYLLEGWEFDGVISYPHPTENELRGDSAVPLHGYNIFNRRTYYMRPRQSRRDRG